MSCPSLKRSKTPFENYLAISNFNMSVNEFVFVFLLLISLAISVMIQHTRGLGGFGTRCPPAGDTHQPGLVDGSVAQ